MNSLHANEDACIAQVAKTIHYVNTHPEEVWPGFKISNTPTLIHFRNNSHVYAFNFTPKTSKWEPVTIDNEIVNYSEKDNVGVKLAEKPYATIDGQLVYIYRFDYCENPHDVLMSNRIFVRKRFAYFLAKESKFPAEALKYWRYMYDGFNNALNVEYTYLEEEALKSYLASNDVEAIKNYVAIHLTRTKTLAKDSLAYETTNNIRFGTSAYVSLKSLNLSPTDFSSEVTKTYNEQMQCPAYEDAHDIFRCLALGHFYIAGPAVGYALDKLNIPNWKSKAENSGVSLDKMLLESIPMSSTEITERLEKSKKLYHFDVIKSAVEKSLSPYIQKMQKIVNEYNKSTGVIVNVKSKNCHLSDYTFGSDENFDTNNKETIYTNFFGKTGCASAKTKSLIEFKKIPFLYKVCTIFHNRFKLPLDTKVIIDDKELNVKDIQTSDTQLLFHTLKLQNQYVIITIKGDGVLNSTTGVIGILFDGKELQK